MAKPTLVHHFIFCSNIKLLKNYSKIPWKSCVAVVTKFWVNGFFPLLQLGGSFWFVSHILLLLFSIGNIRFDIILNDIQWVIKFNLRKVTRCALKYGKTVQKYILLRTALLIKCERSNMIASIFPTNSTFYQILQHIV